MSESHEPRHYGAAVGRPETVAEFAANLEAVRTRIATAAEDAGRSASQVRLLPVSKTVPDPSWLTGSGW